MRFDERRMTHALMAWIFLIGLASCGEFRYSMTEPVAITQQVQRSTTVRPSESTRVSVRAALGEPWLQSHFWGFDLYRVSDTITAFEGLFVFLPLPIGHVSAYQVDGYVLIAYDPMGRVVQVSSGKSTSWEFSQDSLMLRARDLNFGIEWNSRRGTQLMADANRLQDYLALRRRSNTCTVILSCDGYQKRPFEPCPDRVAIDDAEPFDPRPFSGSCDPAKSCPPMILPPGGESVLVPMVHPISLTPGPHRLVMTNSRFVNDRHETSFECAPGEVRYAIIRGHVKRDSLSTTLNASVTFEQELPTLWASYSMLLYSEGHWLAEPEPGQP